MKTIAQQLNIKEFPFKINDNKGNEIYFEGSDGYWSKREYNNKGNVIYYEDSLGYWYKREYDEQGNRIYYEDIYGRIIDNRKVELTLDEIAEKFGINVEQLKIKK
jgi:predicted metal-dependent hydrolase